MSWAVTHLEMPRRKGKIGSSISFLKNLCLVSLVLVVDQKDARELDGWDLQASFPDQGGRERSTPQFLTNHKLGVQETLKCAVGIEDGAARQVRSVPTGKKNRVGHPVAFGQVCFIPPTRCQPAAP
jgi:hypothetical protein